MEESSVNPYQSPLASCMDGGMTDAGQESSRPTYKLYSLWSIIVATLFGSLLAGGIVMSINYRRLGFPGKAIHAVVWSVVATVGIMVISAFLPDDIKIPDIAIAVPLLIAMIAVAKTLQGASIATHEARGGSFASAWGAAGIGILSLIAFLMCVGAVVFLFAE